MKYWYSFCRYFVRDDVIIARPFDATFVINAGTFMLTTLVIYVAHRYRRTRVRVGVQTIVFHDSSDVPHNTVECYICLCNFVVGDQLASLQPRKHVYHRRCIACALAWAPTYPICRGVLLDGDVWVWHPDYGMTMLSFFFFFFFFLCYSFLCRLTIMTMLIYIVA